MRKMVLMAELGNACHKCFQNHMTVCYCEKCRLLILIFKAMHPVNRKWVKFMKIFSLSSLTNSGP